jgi:hypothetical protein
MGARSVRKAGLFLLALGVPLACGESVKNNARGFMNTGSAAGAGGTAIAGTTAAGTGGLAAGTDAGARGGSDVTGPAGTAGKSGAATGGSGGATTPNAGVSGDTEAGAGGEAGLGSGGALPAGGGGTGGAGSAGAPVAGSGNTTFVCPAAGAGAPGIACVVDVVDADDALVDASVAAAVTVVRVDAESSEVCGNVAPSQRLLLRAADDREWTVVVSIAGLPDPFVEAGAELELSLTAAADTVFYTTLDQTLTLADGDGLLLFQSHREKFGTPPLPELGAFDLSFENTDSVCATGSFGPCQIREHAVRVSSGGETATIAAGSADIVGEFVVAAADVNEWLGLGCDGKSVVRIAGFRAP